VTLILEGQTKTFEGTVEGRIMEERRGKHGFGYDPIFVPDGHEQTFAQMTMEQKIPISHRGRAVEKLISFLSSK